VAYRLKLQYLLHLYYFNPPKDALMKSTYLFAILFSFISIQPQAQIIFSEVAPTNAYQLPMRMMTILTGLKSLIPEAVIKTSQA